MGRYAKDSGGDFTPAPAGNHRGICIELIDLGTQHSQFGTKNQVMIRWELSDELMDDGKPYIVGGFFTNSLNEKSKLRPLLESWRGRPFTEDELLRFDLQNILGAPCLVSVIHTDGKARVSGASALPKGMERPTPRNQLKSFWIEEWNQAAFDAIPDGIQKIIMKSDEYNLRSGGRVVNPDADDDPF